MVNSCCFLGITAFFPMFNKLPKLSIGFMLDLLFLSFQAQLISLFRKSEHMLVSSIKAPPLISLMSQNVSEDDKQCLCFLYIVG